MQCLPGRVRGPEDQGYRKMVRLVPPVFDKPHLGGQNEIYMKLRHDTLVGSSGELGSEGTENPGPVSANICASGLAFPLPYS